MSNTGFTAFALPGFTASALPSFIASALAEVLFLFHLPSYLSLLLLPCRPVQVLLLLNIVLVGDIRQLTEQVQDPIVTPPTNTYGSSVGGAAAGLCCHVSYVPASCRISNIVGPCCQISFDS